MENDDLVEVYTHDGKLITVTFDDYINNLTYYNNNLSKVYMKNLQKEYFTKLRTELESINKEIARRKKDSHYLHDFNYSKNELEIDRLIKRQKQILSILNASN